MNGIISHGSYVPYWRLQRSQIAGALGTPGGKGSRAVASYDEDTTSMGVEAARIAMRAAPEGLRPRSLLFATANPAYLDKTNATAIHAALGLDESCLAVDMAGSARSGAGALWAAMQSSSPTLVILSDLRTGLPGGSDEREGGDAAAAFLFGDEDHAIAETCGFAAVTGEFLERWRIPGRPASHTWEERFGEHVYVPLGRKALAAALADARVEAGQVDSLLIAGLHARSVKQVVAKAGVRPEANVDDLTATIGNCGTAHLGVLLAHALDRAEPGKVVAGVLLADGATAFVFRTSDAIATPHTGPTVADQIASGRDDLAYNAFLTWRGLLDREPPRRPDPQPAAPPPAYRSEGWKFGFTASECSSCGTRHLPPARVCVRCGAVDQMQSTRLADSKATVATFTIDRLAFTPSPPLVAAILDFDGGGRYQCELTDVDPDSVAIGDRVEMTFRKLVTASDVHNYFWKARPVRGLQTSAYAGSAAAREAR